MHRQDLADIAGGDQLLHLHHRRVDARLQPDRGDEPAEPRPAPPARSPPPSSARAAIRNRRACPPPAPPWPAHSATARARRRRPRRSRARRPSAAIVEGQPRAPGLARRLRAVGSGGADRGQLHIRARPQRRQVRARRPGAADAGADQAQPYLVRHLRSPAAGSRTALHPWQPSASARAALWSCSSLKEEGENGGQADPDRRREPDERRRRRRCRSLLSRAELRAADMVFSNLECCLCPAAARACRRRMRGSSPTRWSPARRCDRPASARSGSPTTSITARPRSPPRSPGSTRSGSPMPAPAPTGTRRARRRSSSAAASASAFCSAARSTGRPTTRPVRNAAGIAVIRGHTAYQVPMHGGRPPANRPGMPPQIVTWADRQYLDWFADDIAASARARRRRRRLVPLGRWATRCCNT